MEEIAKQEGVSVQTISRSIHKAEKNIKIFLIGGEKSALSEVVGEGP